jgi:hypothetical protein
VPLGARGLYGSHGRLTVIGLGAEIALCIDIFGPKVVGRLGFDAALGAGGIAQDAIQRAGEFAVARGDGRRGQGGGGSNGGENNLHHRLALTDRYRLLQGCKRRASLVCRLTA